MSTPLSFELQRITRRRGAFFGCMAFAAAIALIGFVAGGRQDTMLWEPLLGIGLVMAGTIIGALAGSYDAAQGTMRYLVLTGTPRARLVGIRVPALMLALLMVAVPAALICLVAMSTGPASATDIARLIGGELLLMLTWGLVSLTVGTMLRSNGAAIAVALVLFLVGNLVTEFVQEKISQPVGDYLLPNVANVVGSLGHATNGNPPFTVGLVAAAVVLVIWLAALLGAAVLRVNRDEY